MGVTIAIGETGIVSAHKGKERISGNSYYATLLVDAVIIFIGVFLVACGGNPVEMAADYPSAIPGAIMVSYIAAIVGGNIVKSRMRDRFEIERNENPRLRYGVIGTVLFSTIAVVLILLLSQCTGMFDAPYESRTNSRERSTTVEEEVRHYYYDSEGHIRDDRD